MKLPVAQAVFMDHFGELYVVAAVFGDVHQPALFEPPDGLHALGGFFHTERRGGDGVK